MCSGCCIKAIRWQDGKLQYMMGGEWRDVPGSPIVPGSGIPNIPPDNPDIPETQGVACSKAYGVWQVIAAAAAALIDVGNNNFGSFYVSVQQQYANIDWDNFNLFKFVATVAAELDWEDIQSLWDEHSAELEAEFICQKQYAFGKGQTLTSTELTAIKTHDFDSPSADLDDFLTDVLKLVEDAAYQEAASYHAQQQLGDCNCVADEPAPPEPEIPEGYGMIAVHLTQSTFPPNGATGITPTGLMGVPVDDRMGVKNAANQWQTEDNPEANNHRLGILFEMPEGVVCTGYYFDIRWEGATSGKAMSAGHYCATTAEGSFTNIIENATVNLAAIAGAGVTDEFLDLPGDGGYKYIWSAFWTAGTEVGDGIKCHYTNLRFNIEAADGSWSRSNVQPEVAFPLE